MSEDNVKKIIKEELFRLAVEDYLLEGDNPKAGSYLFNELQRIVMKAFKENINKESLDKNSRYTSEEFQNAITLMATTASLDISEKVEDFLEQEISKQVLVSKRNLANNIKRSAQK